MSAQGGEQKKSPTIVTVAEHAQVSIGTVSRFLNGYKIKESNKLRVEAAIKELSYSRNAFASAMKSQASNMVGLLVPDYDEFHAHLTGTLVPRLRKEGLVTLTYFREYDETGAHSVSSLDEAIDFFRTHRIAALVLSAESARYDAILAMQERGVHVVSYDHDPKSDEIDSVVVNNRAASREATAHLLDHGHRRIGMIGGLRESWTAQERLAGYCEALEEAGIAVDENLIHHGNWLADSGYAGLAQFWNMPDRPTAVFGANHQMTQGMIAYIRDNGIMVPQDLSLVSFDDINMFRFLTPAVTAIAQPVEDIAATIAQMLQRRLSGKVSDGALSEVLPCDFRARDSVARVRS